ncbi:hypothetical protein FQZ97_1162680 [compost metagenome]
MLPDAELDKAQAKEEEPDTAKTKKVRAVQMGFVMSPFVIDGPCFLRVRVETEEKELKGLGLRIEQGSVEGV